MCSSYLLLCVSYALRCLDTPDFRLGFFISIFVHRTNATVITYTPTPPQISNAVIDVGQNSIINSIITGGAGAPFGGNWIWTVPSGNVITPNTVNTIAYNTVQETFLTNAVTNDVITISPYTSTNVLITLPTSLANSVSIYANFISGTDYGVWTLTANTNEELGGATANALTNTITLTINPALATPTISATNTLVDNGQTVNVIAFESGGTTPYTYNFLVFNSITNTLIANQLGTTNSFAFAANGFMVGNTYKANVLVTDSATTNVVANSVNTVTITVNSALSIPTITATNTLVDNGQTVNVIAYETGGTLAYTYNFLVFNSITNTLIANQLGTTNSFAFAANGFMVGNTYKANVLVKDAATTSNSANSVNTVTITVNSALSIPTITATNTLVDNGQTVNVIAYETGGTLAYTYNFLVFNSITNTLIANQLGTTNSFAFAANGFMVGNTYKANVLVKDAATTSNSANSVNTVTITVNSALVTPTITATNTLVDNGQTVNVIAYETGGTLAYTYNFLVFNSITNTLIANQLGTTNSFAFAANGFMVGNTYKANVLVTDSATTNVVANSVNTVTITVNSALSIPTITATNTLVDNGQTVNVIAYETGGTLAYTYNFLVFNSITNTLIANQLGTTNSFAFAANGFMVGNTYKANVLVKDAATTSNSANSVNTVTITVNSALVTPTITATNTLVDNGQTVNVIAYETGGTLPYTYNFLVFNSVTNILIANQLGTANAFAFAANGFMVGNTYKANVLVTDAATTSNSANSVNTASIIANSLPTVTITPNNVLLSPGQIVTYTITVSGGSATFNAELFNVTGSSQQGSNVIISTIGGSNTISFAAGSPTSTTNFQYNALVTDTGTTTPFVFNSVTNTITVKVSSAGSPVTGGGVGGGGGGGSSKPVITTTNEGSNVSNVAQLNAFNISLNGTTVRVVDNYVNPNSTGITINGIQYLLTLNKPVLIGNTLTTNYYAKLVTLSYLPILQTVNISFYSNSTAPAAPSPILNGTYNVISSAPTTVNISNTGTIATLTSSSTSSPVRFIVTNLTGKTSSPQDYKSLIVLNVSTSGANVTTSLIMKYQCSISPSAIVPYKLLKNGTWSAIKGFSVNPTACSVTFTIPPDPVVGLFQNVALLTTTILPTIRTTQSTSSTMPATVTPSSNNSNSVLIAAIIVMIILVIAYLSTKKKGKK